MQPEPIDKMYFQKHFPYISGYLIQWNPNCYPDKRPNDRKVANIALNRAGEKCLEYVFRVINDGIASYRLAWPVLQMADDLQIAFPENLDGPTWILYTLHTLKEELPKVIAELESKGIQILPLPPESGGKLPDLPPLPKGYVPPFADTWGDGPRG